MVAFFLDYFQSNIKTKAHFINKLLTLTVIILVLLDNQRYSIILRGRRGRDHMVVYDIYN